VGRAAATGRTADAPCGSGEEARWGGGERGKGEEEEGGDPTGGGRGGEGTRCGGGGWALDKCYVTCGATTTDNALACEVR